MSLLIYAVCGSAHSGKSEFIGGVLSDGFAEESTLYLALDGASEIAPQENVHILQRTAGQDLIELLQDGAARYQSTQAILECSEQFDLYELMRRCEALPDFEIYQIIMICNTPQFLADEELQAETVKKFVSADMVVFNRCTKELAAVLRTKNIRLAAPAADVYLEYENHDSEDFFDPDVFPFLGDGDEYVIDDALFGTFYCDLFDSAPEYIGKTVTFNARLMPLDTGEYVAVRYYQDIDQILTLGIFVKSNDDIAPNTWCRITGTVTVGECELYAEEGPIVTAVSVCECDAPEQELILF